ncbi:MAG: thermonuclease family protein, partial [Clostridium sp.]
FHYNKAHGEDIMKKIMFFCLLVILAAMPVQANTKEEVEFSKCTDGDTAHFLIRGKDTTVRFLAINAPEYTKTKEPYGKEASEYVCDILTNANTIELEYDDGSDTLDKYGRTLAWVYADDVLLQRELVQRGLAEVKYIYGDYAYTEELKTLEKEAKKEKLNMWSDGKAAAQEQTDSLQYILGAAGGLVLIIFGLFFAKGKRNKERYIRKGVKQLRKKR